MQNSWDSLKRASRPAAREGTKCDGPRPAKRVRRRAQNCLRQPCQAVLQALRQASSAKQQPLRGAHAEEVAPARASVGGRAGAVAEACAQCSAPGSQQALPADCLAWQPLRGASLARRTGAVAKAGAGGDAGDDVLARVIPQFRQRRQCLRHAGKHQMSEKGQSAGSLSRECRICGPVLWAFLARAEPA